MTPAIKTVTFVSRHLGINADLLLVFDDEPIDGHMKHYPTPFAIRKFGAKNTYRSDIIYRSQLAFTKVIISDDVIQSASTEALIDVGQSTILTLEDERYSFSEVKTDPSVPKNNIQCTNNAPLKEDIGVGFITEKGDKPKTTWVWRGVGHGKKLNVEFIPRLRGYIDAEPYQEDGLIMGPIKSDRLFDQDLNTLEKHTTWVITYDKATAVFRIDEEIKSEL